ncbi:MAG: hypothetical protein PHI79_08120 [Sulfurovaceae bacterium]|nr:hypothetical protein [Sulfurovaceae bacterium]MDD5549541.1 hypothetical protein [Sulfurovaceae bacterium]
MTLADKLRMCGAVKKGIKFVGGDTIGFEGLTTDKIISLASLVGGIDTQPRAGDIVMVINGTVGGGAARNAILPTGYTELFSNTAGNSNHYYAGAKMCYKVMGGTPDTSLIIPGGTGSTSSAGSISFLVFRNQNGTPIDVASQYYLINNSALANPPSITPITNGAVIICAGVAGHGAGEQTFTSSDLTNFVSSGFNDSLDCTSGIGYKEWTGGAFDAAAFGFTTTDSTNYGSCAYTIALRPKT